MYTALQHCGVRLSAGNVLLGTWCAVCHACSHNSAKINANHDRDLQDPTQHKVSREGNVQVSPQPSAHSSQIP